MTEIMAIQTPCTLTQMPAEILQQILVNVMLSLDLTTGSKLNSAQNSAVHAPIRAPYRYWTFWADGKMAWSYDYLAGDFKVLRNMLSLKLVCRKSGPYWLKMYKEHTNSAGL